MTGLSGRRLIPAVVATLVLFAVPSTAVLKSERDNQRPTNSEGSSSNDGRSLLNNKNSYYGNFISSVFSQSPPNFNAGIDSTISEDFSRKGTIPDFAKKQGPASEKKMPGKSIDGKDLAKEGSFIKNRNEKKNANGESNFSKPIGGDEGASRQFPNGSSNAQVDGSNSKKPSGRSNTDDNASSKQDLVDGSEASGNAGPKELVKGTPGNNNISDDEKYSVSSIFARGGEEGNTNDKKAVVARTKSTNKSVGSNEKTRVDEYPPATKTSSTAGIVESTFSGTQPSIKESTNEKSASGQIDSEVTANGKIDENTVSGSFAGTNEQVAVQESTIGDISRTYAQLPHRNADGVHGYKTIKSVKGASKDGKLGKGKGSKSSSKSKNSSSKKGKGGKGKGLRSKKKSSSKSIPPPSPSPLSSPQRPTFPPFQSFTPSQPSPTPPDEIPRIFSNILFSYVDAERQVEPTAAEYNELAEATVAWLELYIAAGLADDVTLSGTEYFLEFTSYGSGYPKPSYNILYSLGFLKLTFSQSNDARGEPPTVAEIDLMLQNSISEDYIRHVVRQIDAFADVTEAYFESTSNTFKPLPEEEYTAWPEISPSPVPASDTSPPKLRDQAGAYRVRLSNVFLAYQAIEHLGKTGPPTEPSAQEYKQQVQNSIIYLEQEMFYHLRDEGFSDDLFLGAKSSVVASRWNASIPDDKFNIYIGLEYVEFLFAYKPENTPDENEIYRFLQEEVSSQDYIVAVWQVPGTFESVAAAVFGKVDQ